MLLVIRRFKKEDAERVSRLVTDTFIEFVSPSIPLESRIRYLENVTPEKVMERSKTQDVYLATEKDQIIGIICGNKEIKCISWLWVHKRYHKKGIARILVKGLESTYKRRGVKVLKVYSSEYAIGFYEKMGYRKTTGIRQREGIVYQPMKKVLR